VSHPEGLPESHPEIVGHRKLPPTTSDVLLHDVLSQFGIRQYVLLLVADEHCPAHGVHTRIETHSAGLSNAKIKAALIDMAAAYDPTESPDD
jgi:hypothetical protein